MEGILSGLFHSKKGKSPSKSDQIAQSKAISDTKNNTVDDTNKPAQQDKDSLTSEPNQGKETQESTVRTSDNRSQNIRLSKSNNTNKPADEDFDIPA